MQAAPEKRIAMAKKNIPVFLPILIRWKPVIDKLTDCEAGILLKAIYNYRIKGEVPDFTEYDRLDIIWCDVAFWLDSAAEKYELKVEKARAAARKSVEARNKAKNGNELPLTEEQEYENFEDKIVKRMALRKELESKMDIEIEKNSVDDALKSKEPDEAMLLDMFKSYNPEFSSEDDLAAIREVFWEYGGWKTRAAIRVWKDYGQVSGDAIARFCMNYFANDQK